MVYYILVSFIFLASLYWLLSTVIVIGSRVRVYANCLILGNGWYGLVLGQMVGIGSMG